MQIYIVHTLLLVSYTTPWHSHMTHDPRPSQYSFPSELLQGINCIKYQVLKQTHSFYDDVEELRLVTGETSLGHEVQQVLPVLVGEVGQLTTLLQQELHQVCIVLRLEGMIQANDGKRLLSITLIQSRAVVFQLFPKTVNVPQKPVGYRLTFIQYSDIIF